MTDQLRQLLRQLNITDERHVDAIVAASEEIAEERVAFDRGEHFCCLEEVLTVRWERYTQNDFTQLRRYWDAWLTAHHHPHPQLAQVYSTTRDEASDPTTFAAHSPSIMSLRGSRPVRLCSFEYSEEHADRAHLCPKTGNMEKADTWIYAASAVLGLGYETPDELSVLSKALRGSCRPGRQISLHTGLNRCHFNLLLFMEQERFFDKKPGVLVLPVYDVNEAKAWNGQPYSVIVLCTNTLVHITPAQIAGRIGLRDTDPNMIEPASPADLDSAVTLLSAVVKASAYCLEHLPGPETEKAQGLWQSYRQGLIFTRRLFEAVMGQRSQLTGSITVPTSLGIIPTGKFVVKINLANMVSPSSTATPAYPDPLLLAYKSSVNWTRLYNFQLLAEAEPPEQLQLPRYGGGSNIDDGISEHSLPEEVHVG
jgi:hypothetical protein